jgi:hypothetical protein
MIFSDVNVHSEIPLRLELISSINKSKINAKIINLHA